MAVLMHCPCQRKCQQTNIQITDAHFSWHLSWWNEWQWNLGPTDYKKEPDLLMGYSAEVVMSTEMSSVKSAPSSSAPIDWDFSFRPKLTDRGRIDEDSAWACLPLWYIYFSFSQFLNRLYFLPWTYKCQKQGSDNVCTSLVLNTAVNSAEA